MLNPAANTMVSLAALFIDVALIRSEVRHEEAVYQKLAAHMPLLARIRAEILSKTVKDGASWRERAAMLPRIAVMALIRNDPSLPFQGDSKNRLHCSVTIVANQIL